MARRLLIGFDTLDKYSEKIMRKRSKKASLSHMQLIYSLKIPIIFNFENDDRSNHEPDKNIQGDNGFVTQSPRSLTSAALHHPKSEISSSQCVRPFSSCGPADRQESAQERDFNKRAKRRCKSAVIRRRTWKSEVDCVPDLATLCQEECKLPIMSTLGLSGFLYQNSLTSNTPRSLAMGSEESDDVFETRRDTGRIDSHPLQNEETNDKLTAIKSEEQTLRHSVLPGKKSYRTEGQSEIPENSNAVKQRHIVSLSIEDEIKKPSNKILSVRQQASCAHAKNVSETVPVSFENSHQHGPRGVRRTDLVANMDSLKRSSGVYSIGDVSLLAQSKLGNVRGFTKYKHTTTAQGLKRNKKTEGMSLENTKVNIHFLATDGTTQVKDGRLSTSKNPSTRHPRGTFLEERQPSIKYISTLERRQKSGEVGPVINGMNPRKGGDEKPSFCTRQASPSKSAGLYRSIVSEGSQSQRPISVGDARKWSYITIAKTLMPAGWPPRPSSRLGLSPLSSLEITHSTDTPVSSRVNPTVPFTAKPVIFENRRGRPASLSTGAASQQPDEGLEKTKETDQSENAKTGIEECQSVEFMNDHDTPRPLTMTAVTERSSSKLDEATEVPAIRSTQTDVLPVINIPTAQTETTE